MPACSAKPAPSSSQISSSRNTLSPSQFKPTQQGRVQHSAETVTPRGRGGPAMRHVDREGRASALRLAKSMGVRRRRRLCPGPGSGRRSEGSRIAPGATARLPCRCPYSTPRSHGQKAQEESLTLWTAMKTSGRETSGQACRVCKNISLTPIVYILKPKKTACTQEILLHIEQVCHASGAWSGPSVTFSPGGLAYT